MRPRVTALLLALTALACEAPAYEPPPAPPEDPEVEAMQELLPPPPPSAWPDDIATLRDTLEAFTDTETCLASLRARTPIELAEGVTDLAYDAFFEDVCDGMRAVRDGSVEACDGLSVSTAQRGCRRRLALFHGEPSACPEDPVTPGREPVCVAWAARDEDLCRAASVPERSRCRAVLQNDPERCTAARGGDRVRCEAEVARYASALGSERRESPAARGPLVVRLQIEGESAERDVARGVRLRARGCRTRVVLAESLGAARVGREEAGFSLELTVPAQLELPASIPFGAGQASLTVHTAGGGVRSSVSGTVGEVQLTRFERRLGGAVEGSVSADLSQGGARTRVRGRFSTYVRDLDALDDACLRR